MKTVWHINSNRWNSAITEYSLNAALSLKLTGWTNFYSGLEGKVANQRAMDLNLDVLPFSSFGMANLFRIIKAKNKIKPDLIIVYGGPETTLAKFFGAIPVIRFRGQDKDLSHEFNPLFYYLSQGHLSGVITPSKQLKEKFSNLSAKVFNVPLGCDVTKFYYNSETSNERPVITILGRLDPIKGHGPFFLWFSLLLQTWPQDLPKPLLKVIGEPANITEEQTLGFAQDVNLVRGRDWDLITDRIPDVRLALAQSHLGVICSQGSEIICRVAEEFLLCGCPIYVSGVGSLDECLVDDSMGFSYGDKKGYEAVNPMRDLLIKSFRESSEEKFRRAEKARKHFSYEAMGAGLELVIGALLGEKSRVSKSPSLSNESS